MFAIDGEESKDSSFPDVRMSMFEIGAENGNERLKEFYVLRDFLEEAEGSAANIFIWVLLKKCIHVGHLATNDR